MSTETTITAGSHVEFKGAQWDVTEIKSGWYALANSEGETAKARLKDLVLVEFDQDPGSNGGSMGKTLNHYRGQYVPSIAASGKKSLNNGDGVAAILSGKSSLEVMQIAESLLDMEPGALQSRYARLNEGQKRMNAGNLIRGAVGKGKIAVVEGELVKGTAE